ncbi:MAG: efflux RND transporter permease subunit [Bacteriovoracaceae bacterium]
MDHSYDAVVADNMSRKDLMTFVRDNIQDQFSTVDGVGEIILGGYIDPNLRIWLNQKKLGSVHQLTASNHYWCDNSRTFGKTRWSD